MRYNLKAIVRRVQAAAGGWTLVLNKVLQVPPFRHAILVDNQYANQYNDIKLQVFIRNDSTQFISVRIGWSEEDWGLKEYSLDPGTSVQDKPSVRGLPDYENGYYIPVEVSYPVYVEIWSI